MSKAILHSSKLLTNIMQKSRFWQRHAQTELNDRQCKVINRLLEAGPEQFAGGLTNRKYAGIAHVSRATAQRELADLVRKEILQVNPGGGKCQLRSGLGSCPRRPITTKRTDRDKTMTDAKPDRNDRWRERADQPFTVDPWLLAVAPLLPTSGRVSRHERRPQKIPLLFCKPMRLFR